MKLSGEINTSDDEDQQKIEKSLALDFDQKLKIKWTHEPQKHRSVFVIDSIKKINKATDLILKWNGEAIDADEDTTHGCLLLL